MSSEQKRGGDITDDECLAWLEREYSKQPSKKETDNRNSDTVRETLWRRS